MRTNVPQPAVASAPPKKLKPKKLSKRLSCTRRRALPLLSLRTDGIDLTTFYAEERPSEDYRSSWVGVKRRTTAHSNGPVLDDEILADPEVAKVIDENTGTVQQPGCTFLHKDLDEKLRRSMEIRNTDRSLGGRIAGSIAAKHGDHGPLVGGLGQHTK